MRGTVAGACLPRREATEEDVDEEDEDELLERLELLLEDAARRFFELPAFLGWCGAATTAVTTVGGSTTAAPVTATAADLFPPWRDCTSMTTSSPSRRQAPEAADSGTWNSDGGRSTPPRAAAPTTPLTSSRCSTDNAAGASSPKPAACSAA